MVFGDNLFRGGAAPAAARLPRSLFGKMKGSLAW
jgi:hypothetical protein